jgi:hypothetical protein
MLLSVNFPNLAQNLDNQLGVLDNALSGTNGIISRSTVALPILNTPLKDLQDARDGIKKFRSTLVTAVNGLNDSQAQALLQQQLYNALSSSGLVSASNDVLIPTFQASTGDVTISLHLHKSFSANQPFKFGLGLPGIPFDLSTAGAIKVSVGLDYRNLTFGLRGGTFFFDGSTPGALALTVDATLAKTSLEGTVGFLKVTATPNSAGPTGFHGSLSFDVTSGGLANPKLTGAADANFTLEAKFAPTGSVSFPSIATDFAMHWGFSSADPDAGATAFGDAPTVKFGDVRFGLGSFLSNLMKPLVDVVHTITVPIQPVLTVLNTPLPILTDLSNAVGWGDVSLLTLAHVVDTASGTLHALPPDWQFVLDMAIKLTDVINIIHDTNFDATGNLYVSVGSFDLSGNNDLRGLAPTGDVTDLSKLNVSNLVPHLLEALNNQQLRDKITGLAPAPFKDKVGKLFDQLKALNNGVQLSFPILDDPAGSVFKLLLGQDVDFASFKAEFHLHPPSWTKTFPFWGPIDVKLDGSMGFDAYFRVAYDTYGLREFIKNPSHPEYVANGLYFDTTKDLIDFSGDLTATAVLNAGVLGVGVQGGVNASNVSLKLHDRNRTGKVRLFAGPADNGLGDTLFDTTGSLTADISAYARVGVDTPLGFAGVEKRLGLGSVTLLDLTSGSIANPFRPPDAVLATQISGGILLLNAGPYASWRHYKTGERDETYVISHVGGTRGDESLSVTAFGVTKQYDHVHLILADTGSGDDTITVAPGVLSDAVLSHSGLGNAQFTYQGSGNATLTGGYGGINVLIGGAGINHLTGGDSKPVGSVGGNTTDYPTINTLIGGTGQNYLRGGDGADNTLQGGEGPNQLIGGNHLADYSDDPASFGYAHPVHRAVNRLIAGPGNDTLRGGDGADNFLIAGKGQDSILGGGRLNVTLTDHPKWWDATNRITWGVGDGQPKVLDATTPGGTLEVLGSDNPDQFQISADSKNLAIGVWSNGKFLATLRAQNFSSLSIDGRGASDRIEFFDLTGTALTDANVNMGKVTAPDGARDEIVVHGTIGPDKILVQLEDVTRGYLVSQSSGGVPPGGSAGPGGSVGTVGATVQPVPGQVLKLTGLGNLTVRAAMLEDHLHVLGEGSGDTFIFRTSKAAPTPDGHRGLITFEATPIPRIRQILRPGLAGTNSFTFQENFPEGDTLQLTRDQVSTQLLPFDVRYQADSGVSITRVEVDTGTGRNTVNVQSTLAGAITTIKANGDDRVNVSSDASANAGTLDGITGTLLVKDGSGSTGLVVSERGSRTGDNVHLTDTAIFSTLLPWRVDYLGSFAHGVTLLTGTGDDTVEVGKTLADTRTTVNTGGGKDLITVHVDPNHLAHDDLVIDGGLTWNGIPMAVLNVKDEADAAVIHVLPDSGRGGVVKVSYLNGMPSTIVTHHLAAANATPDADHSYVRSLIHAILGRNASMAELEPLVALLHQQTAADPAARRLVIVQKLEQTEEARRVLVQKWYTTLMGREPSLAERDAQVKFLLQPGTTEEQGLRMLYSGVTFYPQLGSPRRLQEMQAFVVTTYQKLVGRAPTDQEIRLGIATVGVQGPGALAYQLVTSTEGRRAAAAADFLTLLGRQASSTELDRWMASGQDRMSIREQLEASQEFYDWGQ